MHVLNKQFKKSQFSWIRRTWDCFWIAVLPADIVFFFLHLALESFLDRLNNTLQVVPGSRRILQTREISFDHEEEGSSPLFWFCTRRLEGCGKRTKCATGNRDKKVQTGLSFEYALETSWDVGAVAINAMFQRSINTQMPAGHNCTSGWPCSPRTCSLGTCSRESLQQHLLNTGHTFCLYSLYN